MTSEVLVIAGRRVLICDKRGDMLGSQSSASELIEAAIKVKARTVAIPHARLGSSFLDWRSRLGREFIRSLTGYGFRVVFVGDFTYAAGASTGLRDYMVDANSRGDVWFLQNIAELEARLTSETEGPAR
jgi:hypothetical protein